MNDRTNPESGTLLPDHTSRASSIHHNLLVVGIGASAGGIKALKTFFSAMPDDNGMAFVVILHLSREHESHLAEILQSETTMKVTQVQETLTVEPNTVYVIPPGKHLKMVDGAIKLVEPEQKLGRRVPIDLLFRTLGDAHGNNAVCIVLSGTGSDGTLGLKRIKESGGIAIVQDPAEAEYDEMPRNAIETDLADVILPVAAMPAKLLTLKLNAVKFDLLNETEKLSHANLEAETLRKILTLLRIRTGHDFSYYKRPTLLRRIARRMMVHSVADIPGYLGFLQEHPDELQSLLQDLLISVTNFFRDRAVFHELEHEIIPRLFHGKGADDTVRVWIAACATGEEAYSIAMLLCEYAESALNAPRTIQVFASDIDEKAITTARNGYYNDTIAADVSPERLDRFFIKEEDHYRVKKSLREMVLFAQHNLLRDPPFSRLDLISCRNLLIYLNRNTQESVLEIFHFALQNESFLLLGSSESAENASTLFSAVDTKHRIYKSRVGVSHYRTIPTMPIIDKWQVSFADTPAGSRKVVSFGEIHHKLVEKYAPPSVLINDDYDIVHSSETAGRYLRFMGGEPTKNLLKVVHPGLSLELRAALIEANQEKRPTESRDIRISLDGESISINLIVRPSETPNGFSLVIFEESVISSDTADRADSGDIREGAAESIVRRLGEELQRTKDRLRATIEQNETSVEELRAANEELQAINEELRSMSEEVGTSKEELQSVNEELTTVNYELKDKIDEVNQFASDIQNLMSSTDIGTIFLDLSLHIKRYTPAAQALFNIIPSDIGRPLEHVTHRLEYDDLAQDAAIVLRTLKLFEREVHSKDDRDYITRFLPYRTIDGQIDGVVLSFIDINERKRGEETRQWLSAVVSSSNDAIISFTLDRRIVSWNAGAERVFGYVEDDVLGQFMSVLFDSEHEPGEIFTCIERGEPILNYETECIRKNGKRIDASLTISPILDNENRMLGIMTIVQDITQHKLMQKVLQEANQRKDEFLAMLAHELRNPLMPILNAVEIVRDADGNTEMLDVALKILDRQTGHIVHLIDDLLDISRITNGKIKLQIARLDLKKALDIAVETSRILINATKHTLTVSLPADPVYLDADLTRIAQIITNLLNNSAKYTQAGGQIWLSAEMKGDVAEIRVKDTGIGIAPEMLSTIFEMFTQIEDDQAPTRGGLGVGLSLVKNLVEMHSGTITARSEGKGKGSEFIVHLPIAKDQSAYESMDNQQLHASEKSEDRTSKRSRILVVDDNRDSAETFELLLSMEHYEVRTAFDGETAIVTALEYHPDTCLLDIDLPDINGYELARRIRAKFPQVLLIAVTGFGQDEDRRRTQEAGFNHHLVKPIKIADLKKLLMDT